MCQLVNTCYALYGGTPTLLTVTLKGRYHTHLFRKVVVSAGVALLVTVKPKLHGFRPMATPLQPWQAEHCDYGIRWTLDTDRSLRDKASLTCISCL
jgi:hypothetical protein